MINMRHCMTALSLVLLLGAATSCKPSDTPLAGQALDSLAGYHDESEARLSTAAATAVAEGRTSEALTLYARLYDNVSDGFFVGSPPTEDKRNILLNYAQLLRKTGNPERALEILALAVEDSHRDHAPKADANPILLNEYAAANIELGKLDVAEKTLPLVLDNANSRAFHADAANLMGITLDAEGKHKEAEQMLRLALSSWRGDQTSVMNNLAVCLASQGRFDESLLILNRALVQAPAKQEIARNIDIVQDLRDALTSKPAAPAPVAITPEKKKK